MKYTSKELLDSVKSGLEASVAKVLEWRQLPAEVLDRKPAPGKWSANECLGHLIIANAHYVKQIEKLKTTGKLHKRPPAETFSSGWLGAYFKKRMEPDGNVVKGKMKAPGFLDASKSDSVPSRGSEVAEQFLAQTRKLLELVEDCRKADLNKTRATTALGKLVTLKLGDALLFTDAHTRRHIVQGQKAVEQAAGAAA